MGISSRSTSMANESNLPSQLRELLVGTIKSERESASEVREDLFAFSRRIGTSVRTFWKAHE